jgi:excisionase family DNA binding protein
MTEGPEGGVGGAVLVGGETHRTKEVGIVSKRWTETDQDHDGDHDLDRDGLQAKTPVRSPIVDKLLLTPEEAAEVLGIGRTKIFSLIREDKLESVQIDRCRRVPWVALQAFVAKLRGGDGSEAAPDLARPNRALEQWTVDQSPNSQEQRTRQEGTNTPDLRLRHGPGRETPYGAR